MTSKTFDLVGPYALLGKLTQMFKISLRHPLGTVALEHIAQLIAF
jgi:hypothetical protein